LGLYLFLEDGNPPRCCDNAPPLADGEPTAQHVTSETAQSRPHGRVKEFQSNFDRYELCASVGRIKIVGAIGPKPLCSWQMHVTARSVSIDQDSLELLQCDGTTSA
jgi:hypothetical protein